MNAGIGMFCCQNGKGTIPLGVVLAPTQQRAENRSGVMRTLDLGTIGAVLSPDQDGLVDTAREIEQLGYSTIWLSGGPLASLDQVAAVVRATSMARVATGIIAVDRFPASDVIALYNELQAEHPGRFVVGLGGAHGADPLTTLNTYLDRLDSVIPQAARVMAALGPKMLRLARERAGGAFPVLITPEYTATARATLGEDATLAVEQLVVLSTDPQGARAMARGPLGFLGAVPSYQSNFRRMGFDEDDIAQRSDRLVDALVPWGDAATAALHVARQHQAGADHVAISIVSSGHRAWMSGGRCPRC